jgi:hypothetical protein
MSSLSVRYREGRAAKPAKPPKVQGGIKIKTGVHSGGIDPTQNHSRLTLRLLAEADRRIESRERLLRGWQSQVRGRS